MQTGRTSWLLVVTFTLVGASSCHRSFDRVSPRPSTQGAITRTELDRAPYASAYHAIEALRPTWLYRRSRATIRSSNPLPIVYLDGIRTGDLEQLHLMSADDVDTMTLLSPADATTLFGTGHPSGAVDVRTRIRTTLGPPVGTDKWVGKQWDSGHRTSLVAP